MWKSGPTFQDTVDYVTALNLLKIPIQSTHMLHSEEHTFLNGLKIPIQFKHRNFPRPLKIPIQFKHMLHSEENTFLNLVRTPLQLKCLFMI